MGAGGAVEDSMVGVEPRGAAEPSRKAEVSVGVHTEVDWAWEQDALVKTAGKLAMPRVVKRSKMVH